MSERDELGRFVSPNDVARYRVTVWDTFDGDIAEKLWEATVRDLHEIEQKYFGDARFEVEVEDLLQP